jgi:peptidoglycan/xylan/chitin deacetylase (PgdA/CDA1 family)
MFTKRNVPCTVFAVARALGRNREAAAAIREAGWDVAGHGLRWEMHANLAPETEREHIRLATEIITECMGSRPEGWYSRYAPSLSTRAILLDAGYSYDSDAYDDELPYWMKVASRDHLVIPYSLVHNDVRFSRQGITTGNDYFDYIKNAVQCVIDEDPPRMLSFGLHNRIIAHPGRAFGLAKALDWLASHPKVWIARVSTSRHTGANGTHHRVRPSAPRLCAYCASLGVHGWRRGFRDKPNSATPRIK